MYLKCLVSFVTFVGVKNNALISTELVYVKCMCECECKGEIVIVIFITLVSRLVSDSMW